MDVPAPPPPPPPAIYRTAPGDISPRNSRETELCNDARTADWLYLGGLVALDVGSIFLTNELKYQESPAVRLVGPLSVGFTFGATLGGGYLALPKCSRTWVPSTPPEGAVHEEWPIALSFALAGAALGPIITGIVTGPVPLDWSTEHRSVRMLVAGMAGFGGALLPYLLPPRTWRAAKALERLRLEVDQKGAFFAYRGIF